MADQHQKHLDNFAAHKDDLISQLRAKGSQQMFEVASLRGDTRYTISSLLRLLFLPSSPLPRPLLSREQGERRTVGLIMSSSNALCLPPSCPAAASNTAEEACSRAGTRGAVTGAAHIFWTVCSPAALSLSSPLSLFLLSFAYLSQPLTRNVTSGEKVGGFSSAEL